MLYPDKLNDLFFSTDIKNRALAFELAKSDGSYEAFVNALFDEFQEIPLLTSELQYYKDHVASQDELNQGKLNNEWELKQAQLMFVSENFFYPHMSFTNRWSEDSEEIILSTFPSMLLKCKFVESLDLGWNKLESIPFSISQLSQLKKLDLSCSQLKSLPESLANLPHLSSLKLYGNSEVFTKKLDKEDDNYDSYRRQLPLFFKNFTQLKHLDLGDVMLDGFPEWFHELRQLESLRIFSGWGSYPYLDIPESFTKLPKLKTLHIGSYTIDTPSSIDNLQSLESLSLQPVATISENIKNLKNLQYLDLSYLSQDYEPILWDGYRRLWDLYDKGVPEGVSRIQLYGLEWLKEMTWLKTFRFVQIEPYAFTELEKEELAEALPNCEFIFEE